MESAPPATTTRRHALIGVLSVSVLAACSAPRPIPPTVTAPRPDRPAPDLPADTRAMEIVLQAMSLVDTPYRFGGNTPQGGFDCSGLIAYVYRTSAGRAMPRTVAQLAELGLEVHRTALQGADLVFFDTLGPLTHAGIYVGGGRFVHAPSTGGRVRLDHLEARYWAQRFSFGRRV